MLFLNERALKIYKYIKKSIIFILTEKIKCCIMLQRYEKQREKRNDIICLDLL